MCVLGHYMQQYIARQMVVLFSEYRRSNQNLCKRRIAVVAGVAAGEEGGEKVEAEVPLDLLQK